MEAVLAALEREGLLSDQRFCEVFVRTRLQAGYGPLRIRQELEQRRVDVELIGVAIGSAEVDWKEQAAGVRRKRFGAALPRDYREWARQARFLQYRGFSSEQIRAALGARDDE